MKLRIKGDSLRLRVTRSEVGRLIETGRIEETIHFGPAKDANLTYALELADGPEDISLRYRPQEIAVVLSTQAARRWAEGDQVGLSVDLAVGDRVLALLVEKDFACLDRSHAGNEDTFPNPKQGTVC
jgi:hypothetical protein